MPVELHRRHPDVQQAWAEYSENEILHVAVAYSNPFRWRTRRELANNCRRHFATMPNVRLHFCELAYGNRPWEVTDSAANPDDIQLRTKHELFHKENILKMAIRSFPKGWQYGMVCDADFHFTRHDMALETIHQLQHYAFVQPYSSYIDLSGNTYGSAQLPTRANSTFLFNYVQNGYKVSPQYFNGIVGPDGKFVSGGSKGSYESSMVLGIEGPDEGVFMRGTGAAGGALAFTQEAINKVGGLPDRCILGHGDWYTIFGLVQVEPPDIHSQKYHPDYKHYVKEWCERAKKIDKNVGYTDGLAIHYFHGSKTRRAYSSRDTILAKHQYSPYTDVFEDWQGILQLTSNKPDFRDDLRRYFISRSEDDPNLYQNERPMV